VDGASIEGEGEQLLASWKKQLLAHADLVFAQEREATADLARLAELEQIVGRLTMELEAAKKSLAALEPSLEEKREVIEMLKSDYPISLVRRFANVSRSSFYYRSAEAGTICEKPQGPMIREATDEDFEETFNTIGRARGRPGSRAASLRISSRPGSGYGG